MAARGEYRNHVDAEALRVFIEWMRALPSDEARLDAICVLHERFHEACGCILDPGERCQCDNDD